MKTPLAIAMVAFASLPLCPFADADPPLPVKEVRVTPREVSENPFSLRGWVFELNLDVDSNAERAEIARGFYQITFHVRPHPVTVKLTLEQRNAFAHTNRLFVQVVEQPSYDLAVPLLAVGNTVTYRREWRNDRFENIPSVQWGDAK